MAVVNLCGMLCAASDSITTLSSMMHGEYGVDDVYTSALTVVGPEGVKGKLPVELTPEEVQKFQDSANKLKAVIAELDLEKQIKEIKFIPYGGNHGISY